MSLPSASVLLHKLSELDVQCIRNILRVEGQIRKTNCSPKSSLNYAVVQLGLSDVMNELLKDGVRNGNTGLHLAFLKYGPGFLFDSLLKIYVRETTRNMTNKDGLSFLHMACTRPDLSIVQAILQGDRVNVNCRVSQRAKSIFAGYSPLHFAVKFNCYEVARLLLKHQADIYAQDFNHSTPLHLALEVVFEKPREKRDVRMIDLLLAQDRRRDNVTNIHGLSHLMVACAGNDAIAARDYIKAAPLESVDTYINASVSSGHMCTGWTPVHFAKEFNRTNTSHMLRGFDATMRQSMTPRLRESSVFDELFQRHENSSICFKALMSVFNIIAFTMFFLLLLPTFLIL